LLPINPQAAVVIGDLDPPAGSSSKDDKGSVILAHTILAENISSRESPNCYGTLLSMGYNLIDKLDGCHFIPTETDLINTPPLLGPLQNNGGTSFTHAPLQNSAAIDGGSPRGCTYRNQTPLLRDQRNHTRPYDGNGDGIAVCDIGAVEYDGESTVVVLPTLTPTLPSGELVSQPQSTPFLQNLCQRAQRLLNAGSLWSMGDLKVKKDGFFRKPLPR
jgi:hypothetical protein